MGIFEEAKERLRRRKEELEKTKSESYAKNFYKEISNAGKGNQMVVVITDVYNYIYVTKASVTDPYDVVAGVITGVRGQAASNNSNLEELSSEYNYVIITANPTTVNEPTTLYIPENINAFQQEELASFEKQVEEHNTKYADKVQIRKVTTRSLTNEDDMSMLK